MKIEMKLTELEWYRVIEGLDNEGKRQATLPNIRGNAKHRANGRKLKDLAKKLRKNLAGKL